MDAMHTPHREKLRLLRQDKYNNDPDADLTEDIKRLEKGEPLAYVIGWTPFLGLRISLATRPLIPRPETEWWTKMLIKHLQEKFSEQSFSFLDLCAGSGAIGLAVLAACKNVHVSFSELVPAHTSLIRENLKENALDASRAHFFTGDLFSPIPADMHFDVIATNPPYIPQQRSLPESVVAYEPPEALFAGEDGLAVIRRIAEKTKDHLTEGGELWLECDAEHADAVRDLFTESKQATLHNDQYGRPRLIVSYW